MKLLTLLIALLASAGAAFATPYAYIANRFSNSVSVIDTATDTVIADIAVGAGPWGVAVGPGGERAYVTNAFGNSVSVIDGQRLAVVATIPLDSSPTDIAVSDDGRHVLVTRRDQPGTVSLIDTDSLTVVGSVAVSGSPHAVGFLTQGAFVPGQGLFLVAIESASKGSRVVALNRQLQVVATSTLGHAPYYPKSVTAAYPDIFVADWNTGTVASIDTVGPFGMWFAPQFLALNEIASTLAYTWNISDPNDPHGELFVITPDTNRVSVVTTRPKPLEKVAVIPVGQNPTGIAITPAGDKAYVTNQDDGTVSVIDVHSRSVIDTIAVGSGPVSVGQFIQPAADYVPNRFAFRPVTGADVSMPLSQNIVVSGSIVVSGINRPTPISIDCPVGDGFCGFSINGGAWSKSGEIHWGMSVRVRLRASAAHLTTTKATLDIGGRSADFSVTTKAQSKAGG